MMGALGVDGGSKSWAGILIDENGRVPGLFAAATSEMVAVARELAGMADDEHRDALTDKLDEFAEMVGRLPADASNPCRSPLTET